MPIEKTVTLYQYDELEPAAQEKARQWYRDLLEPDDYAEFVIQDAETVARILGVDFDQKQYRTIGGALKCKPAVYWSGFSSQGDGASFDGSYKYVAGSARAIRKHAPQDQTLHAIADDLQKAQARHFYKLQARCKQSGHYMHSGCMDVDVTHAADEYRNIGDAEKDIRAALRRFADWIYRELETAYEYAASDESIAENIRANEYTFTAAGRRED